MPASVLAELADDLVAVHGQSDQQRLLAPARQRAALDRFAGDAVMGVRSGRTAQAYDRLRVVESELAEITAHARGRAQEADLLRHGLAEIEAVAPRAGRGGARSPPRRRGSGTPSRFARRRCRRTLHCVRTTTPPPASTRSPSCPPPRRALDAQREHDAELGALADRLADASAALADVAAELASYAAGIESDPLRLAAVQERRALLAALTRKYGATVDEVLAWAEDSRAVCSPWTPTTSASSR